MDKLLKSTKAKSQLALLIIKIVEMSPWLMMLMTHKMPNQVKIKIKRKTINLILIAF
jgi:hypothetical protein